MINERSKGLFIQLYSKYYSEMHYWAKKVLDSDDIAEDLVQETFVIAYKKVDDLVKSTSPKGWLYKTLRHVIGDNYRRRASLIETISLSESTEIATNDAANLRLELEGSIGKTDLDILIRVYTEGYTYKEISEIYGISIPAAKKRVQRAKEKLREEFDKMF